MKAIILTLMMASITFGPRVPSIPMHCLLPYQTVMAMGAQMPPPNNPNHQEPAPGQNCVTKGDAGHQCECHRECKSSENEENGQITVVVEDPKCRSYCFHDHCNCEIHGCP